MILPKSKRGALAAALSIALALPSASAAQEATPPVRWQVEWGEQYCTLSRQSMGTLPVGFGLQVIPGTDDFSLILLGNDAWKADAFSDGGKATVLLLPSGDRFEANVRSGRRPEGDQYLILSRPDEPLLLGRLAGINEIRLERDGEVKFALPVPSAASAMAAVRQCMDGILEQWGVDTKAYAALRERPRLIPGQFFVESNDYPLDAIREQHSGKVIARLAVAASGKVTGCKVVASSGHQDLDRTTCSTAIRRGRLIPAIGADGHPTAAPAIYVIRWALP